MMSTPESAALLAHIVSQVETNVRFLVAQNYLSRADADAFLAKLPENGVPKAANASSNSSLVSRVKSLATSSPPLKPPQPQVQQARAVWGYNENGQESDDLSFSAGDIIDIIEETNADWWLGKVHGKQALFPSAYVEKISAPAPAPAPSSAVVPARTVPPAPAQTGKTPYRPFGAAHHGLDGPPPPGQGVNSVGLQQANAQEEKEKKGRFGKYGETMAHSAAGGVGFGAGAAIGGGLVRAIF
ncbi:putative variant SH3 domain containing protein [Lyophyllum shimeji]|uniref:Variant SH3 domain containing protein n=1 Tax=Lyophyllum shimeji TaxID=47721 RepID=A0A9P3PRH6_LYOSH|nr:putative variant SH3 domain containing protein [Lyophyllum shimeji]